MSGRLWLYSLLERGKARAAAAAEATVGIGFTQSTQMATADITSTETTVGVTGTKAIVRTTGTETAVLTAQLEAAPSKRRRFSADPLPGNTRLNLNLRAA